LGRLFGCKARTPAATFEIVRRSQILSDSERMSIQNLANPGMCFLFSIKLLAPWICVGATRGSHGLICVLVADPFDTEADDFEQTDSTKENYIHIRIQQRNGRKTLTTLQGLSPGGYLD
jgi:hypothetical protein